MDLQIKTFKVGPLGSNCYGINAADSDEVLIIDAGGDFERIRDYYAQKNKKVTAALLTHGHFDHIFAARDFQAAGAKIYLTEADENLAKNGGDMGRYFGYRTPEFVVDNRLIEGDLLVNGIKIEVVFTAGHTAGGASFKIGDYLFTGDTLMKDCFGRYDFISGDAEALRASAKKLFSLKNDCVLLAGHGEPTTLFYERDNNPVNFI